jgi:ABC-type spermidine/putrescine transport system permease subunit II
MTLGATRLQAWGGITLRLLVPAMLSGVLFAFLTSFDEAVFSSFLSGPGLVTLPKAIFDSVRLGVDPVITAIATTLMVFTAILMGLASILRRKDTSS